MPTSERPDKPVRICDACFNSYLPPAFQAAVDLGNNDGGINGDGDLDSEEEMLALAMSRAGV